MSYEKLPPVARFTMRRSEFKYDYHPDTKKYTLKPNANPKAPDYFGTLSLAIVPGADPVKLRLSGWVVKSDPKSGKEEDVRFVLSGSADYHKDETRRLDIKARDAFPATPQQPEQQEPQEDMSDLPF